MPTTTEKTVVVKRRRWSVGWIIVVIVTNALFVAYTVYAYIKGKQGEKEYEPVYNLLRRPSWEHFKAYWAHMANDPWTDILLIFFFIVLPVPFLPYHFHERIEVMLAKLGIYQMLTAALLGPPNYKPHGGKWQGEGKVTYILGWVFVGVITIAAAYSYYCAKGKIPLRYCLKF